MKISVLASGSKGNCVYIEDLQVPLSLTPAARQERYWALGIVPEGYRRPEETVTL